MFYMIFEMIKTVMRKVLCFPPLLKNLLVIVSCYLQ